MTFILYALLLAQPQPREPSPEEVTQRFIARLGEISQLANEDPERAVEACTALIDDHEVRKLEGRSPAIAMYREQAIYLRASLRLNRGEADAVIADMTTILERKRAQLAVRVASSVGSSVPVVSSTPFSLTMRVNPFVHFGSPFSLWDWQHALAVRAQAFRETGQDDRAEADLALQQEITREMFQGMPEYEEPYPYTPPERSFWYRFFRDLPESTESMVASPWFIVGVFVFAFPFFFLSGRRQRRDAGGTWLRLLGVSLILAVCFILPLLAAFLLLRSRPYLFYTSSLFFVTLGVLVFHLLWLRSYVTAVTWEQTSVAPPLLEDQAVLDRIRELSDRMGIATPVTRLIHSPSSQMLNQAGVAGLVAPTVVVFDGILHRLSEEERDAIIAHELAHLANYTFWYRIVMGCAVSVAVVAAAAFFPAVVVVGLGMALLMGGTLFLTRWFELDCDRRAARAIGHRRAASALFKIHADEPYRNSSVLEFLIGAISTHPSRDERLAAVHRDAPPDAKPDVEWDPRVLPRRRLASWFAIGLWLAIILGSLFWSYRSPGSRLPAIPLFLIVAAPIVLFWLGLRKTARRQKLLRKDSRGWLTTLLWIPYLLLGSYVVADYFDYTERYFSKLINAIIILVGLVACVLLSWLTRRGGGVKKVQQKFAIAFQSGDYAGALEVFESSPEVVAGNTLLRHDRALTLALLGRREDAINEMEKLLRDDPSFKLTWLNLAGIYSDEGQFERALELSAELTRDLPGEPSGAESEAWILRKLGRLEEAEAKVQDVLKLDPTNGSVYLVLSGVALDRGDFAAAREHLARAERAVPGTVGVALLAAEIAIASADPNAESLVQSALKAAKNNPLAFADKEAAALARRLEPEPVPCAMDDAEPERCEDGELGKEGTIAT